MTARAIARLFGALMLLWAGAALAAGALAAQGKGHPPGVILLPVIALAWMIGHFMLFGLSRLVQRRASTRPAGMPPPRIALATAKVVLSALLLLGVLAGGLGLAGGGVPNVAVPWLIAALAFNAAAVVGLARGASWSLYAGAAILCFWTCVPAGLVVIYAFAEPRPALAALAALPAAAGAWLSHVLVRDR